MATSIEDIRYKPPPLRVRVAETVLLTLLVPAIGLWFHEYDPLFLEASFAWLVAAPLLAGLRYGFIFGFGSALATVAIMTTSWRLGMESGAFPLQYAIGLILVGMVVGEFTDVWRRRLGQMRVINDYQATRLDEFVRNYHLLRVSHDQLAERLAANPYNLRDALRHLGRRLQTTHPLEVRAGDILNFLAWHGMFQQAAFYAVDEKGEVRTPALARLGREDEGVPDSPMVRACLSERCMISLRGEWMSEAGADGAPPLLAVVPLLDVEGRLWGIVTITDMPFMAYHDKTLNLLAVLGGNLGDLIKESQRSETAHAGDTGGEFRQRLRRWIEYARRYRLESLVMAVQLPEDDDDADEEDAQAVVDFLFEQLRVLDYPVMIRGEDGRRRLLILMPLTPLEGARAYRARIGRQMLERFGKDADESGLRFLQYRIDGKTRIDDVLEALHTEAGVASV